MFELILYFSLLSLLSIGGVAAVMPEVYRYTVDVQGWVTGPEFVRLLAIAQAAPGPNVLISSLIGWRVSGLGGAVAALLAMCGPSSVLAWYLGDLWERFREAPWRRAIQRGLAPLTVGLIFAGGGLFIATAIKLGRPLWPRVLPLAIAATAFGAVGLARLPLLWVFAVLVPVALALARAGKL